MAAGSASVQNNPTVGIAFILFAMFWISINDMLIKQLSGAYPMHQMVFVPSVNDGVKTGHRAAQKSASLGW